MKLKQKEGLSVDRMLQFMHCVNNIQIFLMMIETFS